MKKWLGLGLIVLIALGAWYYGGDLYTTARIGTAYAAKQTCSCRFVAGRAPESCPSDYNPNDLKSLTVNVGTNKVTVSALAGVISATAVFEDGFGCHVID